MPPTSFFERGAEDDGNEEAQDLESILDEALAARMPHYRLTGHYRSRHESLICFSNHAYYGGELVTYLHSYAVGDRDVEVVRADLLDAIARKPPRTMTADIAGITAHELVRRLRRP